jgi:hypothetical protein
LVLSLTVDPPMARFDGVPTFEKAKAWFRNSWDASKAWAKLEERDGSARAAGRSIKEI